VITTIGLTLMPVAVRWALFEDSSHMPHVEERQACMGTVVKFLDEVCSVHYKEHKAG
jgi:L-proline amide hydrolase